MSENCMHNFIGDDDVGYCCEDCFMWEGSDGDYNVVALRQKISDLKKENKDLQMQVIKWSEETYKLRRKVRELEKKNERLKDINLKLDMSLTLLYAQHNNVSIQEAEVKVSELLKDKQ